MHQHLDREDVLELVEHQREDAPEPVGGDPGQDTGAALGRGPGVVVGPGAHAPTLSTGVQTRRHSGAARRGPTVPDAWRRASSSWTSWVSSDIGSRNSMPYWLKPCWRLGVMRRTITGPERPRMETGRPVAHGEVGAGPGHDPGTAHRQVQQAGPLGALVPVQVRRPDDGTVVETPAHGHRTEDVAGPQSAVLLAIHGDPSVGGPHR